MKMPSSHSLLLLSAALLLCAALAAACRPGAGTPPVASSSPAMPAFKLRTYEVPPGHEGEVERLLSATQYPVATMGEKGPMTQFVRLNVQFTGGNRLVVSAPEGIHEGVRQMLDVLGKQPPPVPRVVQVTYWMVVGHPLAEGEQAAPPPQLAEAGKVLEGLAAIGPMRFELLERVEVRSLSGEQAEVAGRYARIKQTPSVDGGKISLRLEAQVQRDRGMTGLETMLSLDDKQFGVLGSVGYSMPDKKDEVSPPGTTLFYVARAELLP